MRQRATTSSLHTSAPQRTYRYGYDSLSRLTRARYSDSEGGTGHYDTRYSYDLGGNLTSLVRRGALSLSSAGTPSVYGAIDSLTLEYAGNRLRSVSDAAAGPHYQGAFHFVDGADEDEEYRYDLNGNTVTDLNRGILSSRFDTAGHPARMDFADGSSTCWLYDDAGTKLRTLHRVASVPVAVPGSQGPALTETVTDYCAGFVYEDSLLSRINLDGAYLSYTGADGSRLTTPEYHFYLRDHLGNNRVDVAADGRVCQMTDYYPYGLPMASSRNAAAQRWLFGGKELDRISGLDLYDFEARAYDPALARFTSPDALREKYYPLTPYLYCAANPLRLIDPDGQKIEFDQSCTDDFKDAFERAYNYLKDHDASQCIDYIANSDDIVVIYSSTYSDVEDFNYFDGNDKSIHWNPNYGRITSNMYFLSPAELLNHEAAHAERFLKDPDGMISDKKNQKENVYGNAEEERVITGPESETAYKLGKLTKGEKTRTDHTGTAAAVPDVDSDFEETSYGVIVIPQNIK